MICRALVSLSLGGSSRIHLFCVFRLFLRISFSSKPLFLLMVVLRFGVFVLRKKSPRKLIFRFLRRKSLNVELSKSICRDFDAAIFAVYFRRIISSTYDLSRPRRSRSAVANEPQELAPLAGRFVPQERRVLAVLGECGFIGPFTVKTLFGAQPFQFPSWMVGFGLAFPPT